MEKINLEKLKELLPKDFTLLESASTEMFQEILDWCDDKNSPIGNLSSKTREFLYSCWYSGLGLLYAEMYGTLLTYNPFIFEEEE